MDTDPTEVSSSPAPPRQEPDWDSFETYRGPEESQASRWLGGIFHIFMLILFAALIFGISGALITLLSYRTSIGRDFAVHETREQFIGKFIGGGVIGWIVAIYYYYRKIPRR